MTILIREGFRYNNYVDIFDAGPTVEAFPDQIRSITASRVLKVKNIIDNVSGTRFLISNTQPEFRATLSQAILNREQHCCILSKDAAELLKVKPGDMVRIVPLKIEETNVFTKVEHENHSSGN
jgi:arginine N-succinyltransferase